MTDGFHCDVYFQLLSMGKLCQKRGLGEWEGNLFDTYFKSFQEVELTAENFSTEIAFMSYLMTCHKNSNEPFSNWSLS